MTNFPHGISSMGIPLLGSGVPPITGTYFHVNPRIGSDGNKGDDNRRPLDSFVKAEDLLKTDVGDGIIVWSQGTAAANCTSYLTEAMAFDKSGCTVFGVNSGSIFNNRSRISAGATDDLAYLMDVSGHNNAFYNLQFSNYGDANTALGCVRVTGEQNFFYGCHFIGAGHAVPGAVALAAGTNYGAHDLLLSGSENTFVRCTFGTNTIIRAAANANIVLSGAQSKNHFEDCRFISYSATAGHGAIALYTAATLNGWITFKNCTFTNWIPNSAATAHTSVLLATGAVPNNCGILFQDCGMIGWALWDSVANNDKVYITNSAGAATGGLGIVAS